MAQVDLNRDFPDYFNPTYQTREMMQPESGAVADWIDSTQFVLSAGFHGGALVANYPYDSNSEHMTAILNLSVCLYYIV